LVEQTLEPPHCSIALLIAADLLAEVAQPKYPPPVAIEAQELWKETPSVHPPSQLESAAAFAASSVG
jgi:hypothetical protein